MKNNEPAIMIDPNLPPETIDVLGKTFTIKLIEPDEEEDKDGYMMLSEQVIGIRLQPAMDYNHDTMIHEIIHAVEETLDLGMKEKQVHLLAVGIISILKHNPELVTWLLR